MNVCMPDGTDVRASSILGKREHAEEPTFGLYMDAAWQPSWPSEFIPWPDRGLPLDWDRAASQIAAAFLRARSGDLVEIGCLGGLGRTGTVLACMAVLAGVTVEKAVPWVRRNHDGAAVDTPTQEAWVRWFASSWGFSASGEVTTDDAKARLRR